MKKFTGITVAGALLLAGVSQGWAAPASAALDAGPLPVMYGKQISIKTPQKVFRLNEFDTKSGSYPTVQVNIGGEKLDFLPMFQPPYLNGKDGGKELGAFMPVYFAFRNSEPRPASFDVNTSTWKLVTVGADKLLYVNPMVKLAHILDNEFKTVDVLWEATPKDYTAPELTISVPGGASIALANYDISHALKVARDTTQGRTLPQMFLVIGDALAYEIPPYTLPQSGPDKAAVDMIVENVEKAMTEWR